MTHTEKLIVGEFVKQALIADSIGEAAGGGFTGFAAGMGAGMIPGVGLVDGIADAGKNFSNGWGNMMDGQMGKGLWNYAKGVGNTALGFAGVIPGGGLLAKGVKAVGSKLPGVARAGKMMGSANKAMTSAMPSFAAGASAIGGAVKKPLSFAGNNAVARWGAANPVKDLVGRVGGGWGVGKVDGALSPTAPAYMRPDFNQNTESMMRNLPGFDPTNTSTASTANLGALPGMLMPMMGNIAGMFRPS